MFRINPYNLERLTCHAQVQEYYNHTKPFRGTDDRPLGSRRDKTKVIRRVNDDDFALYYYQTPIVTFHANGDTTVVVYPSLSSQVFLNYFVKFCRQIRHSRNEFFLRVNGEYFLPRKDSFFRFNEKGVLISAPPEPAQEWKGDKSKMAQTRKFLKPFMLWQSASLKMGITEARFSFRYYTRSTVDNLITRLLAAPEDSSLYFDICQYFRNIHDLKESVYMKTGALALADVPRDRLPRNRR